MYKLTQFTLISCVSTGQTLYYKQTMGCDVQLTEPDDLFTHDLYKPSKLGQSDLVSGL